MYKRDYADIAKRSEECGDRTERMQAVVDALWRALLNKGVSWVGFYLPEGENQLVLGPSCEKPACSPIGMHGVCGQSFRNRQAMIVHDVRDLGDNYVACDPRDRSEVVVPLLESDGHCWAVLDLDSFEVGAFNESDIAGLQTVLHAADLTI